MLYTIASKPQNDEIQSNGKSAGERQLLEFYDDRFAVDLSCGLAHDCSTVFKRNPC